MKSPTPVEVCEAILAEKKRYNMEHHIWPSQCAIVERLLARQLEMSEVYAELHRKLHIHPHAINTFLGLVLSTAAFWNPERLGKARAGRERLALVNRKIALAAAELAGLLEERSELHNSSGFHAETHYDVCDVLDKAAAGNYRYKWWVRDKLRALSGQFDLKYWPSLSDFVGELARDAARAEITASDPLTGAGTEASRPSRADFFKALFAAMQENRVRDHGFLPNSFHLTDSNLASLANCALDLDPEISVDGPYVKRLRQRERNKRRAGLPVHLHGCQ